MRIMERSNSLSSSNNSSNNNNNNLILSVQCLKGSSKAEEWTGDLLQTGDVVEELRIGNVTIAAPFKNGKSGVQKLLHTSFKAKETSVRVRVRRAPDDDFAELHACLVPNESAGRKQYVLRAIDDPNYVFGFVDRTESDCFQLQASRKSRMVAAIAKTQLQDGYVSYPWEKRTGEMLAVPNSSSFYSILLLPKAISSSSSSEFLRYDDIEDTLARANAWLNSSQASGVPILFMNIQTESLLTKISGETASSTVNAGSLSDLSNLANASLYGFEDYHGVDIGVVRAVRLWFSPIGGEIPIEINIHEHDTKLGFAISRTEEGFIYISSVIQGDETTPSTRSGLSNLYEESSKSSKLLVVSRISHQKVLPWMASPTGAIRCYDTVSLSQKLSLHRHAKVPILIHVFLWDRHVSIPNCGSIRSRAVSPPVVSQPLAREVVGMAPRVLRESQVMPVIFPDDVDGRLDRDTAGESSFRFHDFSLPNNWV